MRRTSDSAFPILGMRFRATGASPVLDAWLRAAWDFPAYDVPGRPFTIRLRFRDAPGPAAPMDGHRVTSTAVNAASLEWVNHGETWWTGTVKEGVRLRVRRGGAGLVAWGTQSAGGQLAVYMALTEAIRAGGWLPLHAAVATRDGVTAAFLGASGTGKSTTLLQAVRAGWTPVAEDLSWLDPDSLTLFGWDRALRLRPDTIARFAPDLDPGAGAALDAQGKVVLSYDALATRVGRPAVKRAPLTLDRIVLLERDGSLPSAWAPLPPRDAVRALWEAVGVPLRASARERAAGWIGGLVGRVDARRLRLGATPLPLGDP